MAEDPAYSKPAIKSCAGAADRAAGHPGQGLGAGGGQQSRWKSSGQGGERS